MYALYREIIRYIYRNKYMYIEREYVCKCIYFSILKMSKTTTVCVQEFEITVKYFESFGKHWENLQYVGKYKKLLLFVYTSLLI